MGESIAHRGPDSHGLWHRQIGSTQIGLVHHRLAVIHREGSHQPMMTSDGRHVMVFNGEILNYRDLRQGLARAPVDDGDAAVLLEGLVEFGQDFLLRIRGQFAYVLVDTKTGRMTAARDPLGILPLFWARVSTGSRHRLVFASEARAIFTDPAFTAAQAECHLPSYLLRRSIPSPDTLLDGVQKVRPGHVLTVDATGTMHEVRYWSPSLGLGNRSRDQRHATDDDLAALVQTAVDRNVVADTSVGVFLSGGLDSTLLAAVAQRRTGTVRTYSAGFADRQVDETDAAKATAVILGTRHREVSVSAAMYAESWGPLSAGRDSPLSEPADIALHYLARRAAQDLTVVLSGEGADELFAGYPKYVAAQTVHRISRIPGVAGAGRRMSGRSTRSRRLQSGLRALGEPDPRLQGAAWFAPFTSTQIQQLTGVAPTHVLAEETPSVPSMRSVTDLMLLDDLLHWLPENLLARADRMCMAASLEVRPPFLDMDVVEAALRLPFATKVHSGRTKWPLRRLAAREFPPALARQTLSRAKAGFRVPLDRWFRGDLRDFLHDHLTAPGAAVSSSLDHAVVRMMIRDHDRGASDLGLQLWTLLSLEVWLRGLGTHGGLR